jgi:hypothetical protein
MNLILGDIHGNVKVLLKYIHREYAKGGTIYQIGDFGVFDLDDPYTEAITEEDLDDINDKLVEHDTQLRVIRGNHDNPKYWVNLTWRNSINKRWSNIEFLPDYHVEKIGDMVCMFIGGAVSVDRQRRMKDHDWWEDEVVSRPPNGIDSLPLVDVVIAHNCPTFFNLGCDSDSVGHWAVGDDELVGDLTSERELIDRVFWQVKPSRWFSGHFHNNMVDEYADCNYRCININELYSLDEFVPFKNRYVDLKTPPLDLLK